MAPESHKEYIMKLKMKQRQEEIMQDRVSQRVENETETEPIILYLYLIKL